MQQVIIRLTIPQESGGIFEDKKIETEELKSDIKRDIYTKREREMALNSGKSVAEGEESRL